MKLALAAVLLAFAAPASVVEWSSGVEEDALVEVSRSARPADRSVAPRESAAAVCGLRPPVPALDGAAPVRPSVLDAPPLFSRPPPRL